MTRIPSWRWDARAACLIALICLAFSFQCTPTGESSSTTDLVISPSTGIQGSSITVSITAEGARFDKCDPLSPTSLHFEHAVSDILSLISVKSVDLVNEKTIRAAIELDEDTPLGGYEVSLYCNGTSTYFSGRKGFEAKAKNEESTLTVSPSTGGAGAINLELTLRASPPFAFNESSYTVFGNDMDIVATKRRIDSPQVMTVWITIASETPQTEHQVVVFSGQESIYGVFDVNERIDISIKSVEPDQVIKPGYDQETPREYELTITGTTDDVGFIQPGADGGAGGTEGSMVSFHSAESLGEDDAALPGIEVMEVDVEDLKTLRAIIAVDKGAPCGRALVRVTTDERQVQTSFWVAPVPDEPYLRVIYPRGVIERGETGIDLVVEGVNFDVNDFQDVGFGEPDCTAEGAPLLVSGRLQLKVSVEDSAGMACTLAVTNAGGDVATAVLLIKDEVEPKIESTKTTFTQGDDDEITRMTLKGDGQFDSETTAHTPLRSGMSVVGINVDPSTGEMFVTVDVAGDAPVGRSLIRVIHAGTVLETPVTVVAADSPSPSITMTPDAFLQGRNQTVIDIQAHDFDFDMGNTTFQFDVPAIRVDGVSLDSANASLDLKISPGARSSAPSVIYTKGNIGDVQAAATFSVLENPKARPITVSPMEITRAPGGVKRTISVQGRDILFDDPVEAFVLNNTGAMVSLVQVFPEPFNQWLNFVLTVDETGPGGWLGVLIYSGSQRLVVPIHVISGDDESLTSSLAPGEVRPGSRGVEVLATSSAEAFQDETTEVFAGVEGAYTTLIDVVDSDQVRFYLDTSVDVDSAPYDGRIPISLTTRKGAVVGFVQIEEISSGQVSESTPWQGVLQSDEIALIDVNPGSVPSLIYGSVSWPGYGDVSLDLRAANGLDEEGWTDTGFLWITDPAASQVVLSPQGDPGGLPSALRVKPIGGNAVLQDGSEWVPEAHPCTGPFLGLGAITDAFDEGRVQLESGPSCSLVAMVIARELGDRPWSIPDLWLELRDNGDILQGERILGWPTATDADPRLYFDSQQGYLAIGPQLGTAGDYLINIRRAMVINGIGRAVSERVIEIVAEPGESLDALTSLVLRGEEGTDISTCVFTNHDVAADGRVVVRSGPSGDIDCDIADNIPATDPFTLLLYDAGEVLDCVQVGDVTVPSCFEGDPVPNDDPMPVFFRAQSIDTDDNRSDFVSTWAPMP